MPKNCLICKKKDKVKFIDDYKFEVESDIKYLGKLKIFGCEECNLYFTDPVPDLKRLNYYYSDIYRAKGRPHNIEYNYSENSYKDDRFLNYLLYLSTFINFKKIKNIFDFGAGAGDLGYLIKKNFNHINLHSCENDKYSVEILNKRGYSNFKDLNQIDKKFDLIISLHSIEHLTNLDPIFTLKNLINEKGYFFFEVPNCPFEKNFIKRPYDAPHLIFFTKKSWEKIAALISLNLINFSYASYSLDDAFIYMSDSKKRFGNYEKGKTDYRKILKKIIPNFIINIRRKIVQANKSQNIDRSKNFINNIENSWCLRGIFQKNN